MNMTSIVLVLTLINFAFQLDFVILMPLGKSVMDHFQMTTIEYASVVGIYSMASGIMSILFSFFGGVFSKKKAMLCSIFFLGLSCFATGLVTTYGQLLIVRFIAGCWGGILNPLIFSIAADAIAKESRGKSIGKIMTGFSLASVLGIPLGIWVMDNYGYQMTFNVFFIGFVLIFIISCFILPRDEVTKKRPHFRELIIDFFNCLRIIEYLKGYFLLFLITGAIFVVVPLISPFAVKNLGRNNHDLQQMYFFGGILTFIISRILGGMCDRLGLKLTLNVTTIFSTIPVLFFVNLQSSSSLLFIFLGSLMMALMSGMMVPAMTISSLIPSADYRSSFNGVLNSLRNFSSSIFTSLAGIVVVMDSSGDSYSNFSTIGYIYLIIAALILIITFLISDLDKK